MGYYFGLSYRPNEKLHLGLTYKTALFHKMEGLARTRIDAFNMTLPFDLMLEVYSWYTPANASFGTTCMPTPAWTIALDLTWYDWSSYPGPFLHTSAADDSSVASNLSYPERVDPEFVDTLVPRLGVEWRVTPSLALRAGYSYRFSPAPLPTGGTNLLDGDMHQGSFGVGYRWNFEETRSTSESPERSAARFYLDFDLYGTIGGMAETKVSKIPAQEPLKSYVFGGMVYDSGLLITLGF
jgi:long-subunit fatty acid transport protein